MKKSLYGLCAVLSLGWAGCQQSGENHAAEKDSVFTTGCYRSVDGTDTALLTVRNYKTKTTGSLVFRFARKPANTGEISGKFHGDTLLADYVFQLAGEKQWHRNPVAFLRSGDKMILGVGKTQTMLGRTYFNPEVPIDYDRGRFTFLPQDCPKP